jgi:hypothetical protein
MNHITPWNIRYSGNTTETRHTVIIIKTVNIKKGCRCDNRQQQPQRHKHRYQQQPTATK